MGALQLVVPDADFSGVGLGTFYPLPDIRSSLYAGYLLGTDYPGAGLRDLTRNGRDLTLASGALGTKSLQCGSGVYAISPVTGGALGAVSNALTMVVIAKAPASANATLASDMATGGSTRTVGLFAQNNNATRAYTIANFAATAVDATRGTAYDMFASVHTLTDVSAYRKSLSNASSFATQSLPTTFPDIGGQGKILFGDNLYVGYTTGAPEIVAVLLYATALTQAELDSVQLSMRTALAAFGVMI